MKISISVFLIPILTFVCISNGVMGNVTNKDLINRLEQVTHKDLGYRGIGKFWTEGALYKAANYINLSKNVVILTGFYIKDAKTAETDGPSGAVAIADAVRSLNKSATIVTDKYEYDVIKTAVLASKFSDTKVIALNTKAEIQNFTNSLTDDTCIVSIERLGKASDGNYYSMSAKDITPYTAPLDDIVLQSGKNIKTIGIGDGGNEIGMGNVHDKIVKDISHGRTIATTVKTDTLITSGVSNWGGYALAFALQILNPNKRVVVPTANSAEKVLKGMVSVGAVDGITSENIMSIDGFPYNNSHADIIRTMLIITVQRNKDKQLMLS